MIKENNMSKKITNPPDLNLFPQEAAEAIRNPPFFKKNSRKVTSVKPQRNKKVKKQKQ